MKIKIAAGIAIAIYIAWLFRWTPVGHNVGILDRWTGNVVIPKIVNEK